MSKYPGGLISASDFRQTVLLAGGAVLAFPVPARRDNAAFHRAHDTFLRLRGRRIQPRLDDVGQRMATLLEPHLGEQDYRQMADDFYETLFRDLWGRWRETLAARWPVTIETLGIDHVRAAQDKGRGVVFWGMSFHGNLLPKMALARGGILYTQLSSADHGVSWPLTRFGEHVAGPLYCLTESRYIRDRVRIPVDEGTRYMKTLVRKLRDNQCIWIAAERLRARQPVRMPVLGRPGLFPTGAPSMAASTGAALLPVEVSRTGEASYRVTVQPAVNPGSMADRKAWIREAIGDYAQRLEQRLLDDPVGWHWESPWVKALVAGGDT